MTERVAVGPMFQRGWAVGRRCATAPRWWVRRGPAAAVEADELLLRHVAPGAAVAWEVLRDRLAEDLRRAAWPAGAAIDAGLWSPALWRAEACRRLAEALARGVLEAAPETTA
jgi:hypothetical protein